MTTDDAMAPMDGRDDNSRSHRGVGVQAALMMAAAVLMPSTAVALPVESASGVAMYTAVAVLVVVVVAVIASLGLNLAVQFGFIGSEREVVVRRRLRVAFGMTFLLAAITPYVALNFSVVSLVVFIAAAGVVVAAWVWGASRRRTVSSESTSL